MATAFTIPGSQQPDLCQTMFPKQDVNLAEEASAARRTLTVAAGPPHHDLSARMAGPEEAEALRVQDRMHRFMVENLHRGLTLKDLSRVIGYSQKYCSEWFLVHMGESFSSYVKRLRLQRATRLLGLPTRLADIAETLGFQDQYAFSHFFKKATGVSPQGFRQRTGFAGHCRAQGARRHSRSETRHGAREVHA